MQYLKKLFLNLIIIALDILLIVVCVKAFTHQLAPIIGVVSVVGILTIIILLITKVQNRYFRYRRPGMFKTTLVVILIAIITAFAGCQPLASYKDKAIDYISDFITSANTNTNTTTITTNATATTPPATTTSPATATTPEPSKAKETTKTDKLSPQNVSEQELKDNPELQKIITDKEATEKQLR
jgi:hypothetical protein